MVKTNGKLTKVTDADIAVLESDPAKFWEGVTSIGAFAFSECKNLTRIKIPDNVKFIEEAAFNRCFNLIDVDLSESKIDEIGFNTFWKCYKLKSVQLPQTLTHIYPNAFGYSGLEHITIPQSVKDIDDGVFMSTPLKSVKIEQGGKPTIAVDCFMGCDKLTEFSCDSEKLIYLGSFSTDYTGTTPEQNINFKFLDKSITVNLKNLHGIPMRLDELMDIYLPDGFAANALQRINKKIIDTERFWLMPQIIKFARSIGLFEPAESTIKIGNKTIPVREYAYNFLDSIITDYTSIEKIIHCTNKFLTYDYDKDVNYSEGFLRFISDKTNWKKIKIANIVASHQKITHLDLFGFDDGYGFRPAIQSDKFADLFKWYQKNPNDTSLLPEPLRFTAKEKLIAQQNYLKLNGENCELLINSDDQPSA